MSATHVPSSVPVVAAEVAPPAPPEPSRESVAEVVEQLEMAAATPLSSAKIATISALRMVSRIASTTNASCTLPNGSARGRYLRTEACTCDASSKNTHENPAATASSARGASFSGSTSLVVRSAARPS